MPINDEQAKTIKEQILKQVEQLPEDRREQIKQYILGLDNAGLEEFLKKNQEAQGRSSNDDGSSESEEDSSPGSSCIMCSISSKKIESMIIYEDKDYLAALEINPYSKGHTILIPKKHLEEAKLLPSKIFTIAKKIGNYLIKKLEAESFQINTSEDLKHAIVNIIPIYKGEKINFQRKPAKKEELQELKQKIGELKKRVSTPRVKKDKSTKETEKKVEKKLPNYPRRIP